MIPPPPAAENSNRGWTQNFVVIVPGVNLLKKSMDGLFQQVASETT